MVLNVTARDNALVCLVGGRGTDNVSPLRSVSRSGW